MQPVNTFAVWDLNLNDVWTPLDLQGSLDVKAEFLLIHRVDLHAALDEANAQDVGGKRADVRLNSRVDPVDGTIYTGDLVLGTNIMHAIAGQKQKEGSTRQRTFRPHIPVFNLRSSPAASRLLDRIGLDGVNVFANRDRCMVVHACRQGSLLNRAGIHASGNINDCLATFNDSSPELQEVCRMSGGVKFWSLATRQPPPTFVRVIFPLLGNAAHPTLSHRDPASKSLHHNGLKPLLTVMMTLKMPNELQMTMLDELRTYIPDYEIRENMLAFSSTSDFLHKARSLLDAAQSEGFT
ncbi:hypothetical protein BDV19DRAFT_401694 [Aspergillus venezuelensis]